MRNELGELLSIAEDALIRLRRQVSFRDPSVGRTRRHRLALQRPRMAPEASRQSHGLSSFDRMAHYHESTKETDRGEGRAREKRRRRPDHIPHDAGDQACE